MMSTTLEFPISSSSTPVSEYFRTHALTEGRRCLSICTNTPPSLLSLGDAQIQSWPSCIMMSQCWRTTTSLWVSSFFTRKTVTSSKTSRNDSARVFASLSSIWCDPPHFTANHMYYYTEAQTSSLAYLCPLSIGLSGSLMII